MNKSEGKSWELQNVQDAVKRDWKRPQLEVKPVSATQSGGGSQDDKDFLAPS